VSALQADTGPAVQAAEPRSLGATLKAARERAGLSLDQAAQQLKLAPRQVRALEDEEFTQLPGRTFVRGFVRNYARLLNLDGDALLARIPDPAHAPGLVAPSLQSTGATMGEVPSGVGRSAFGRWLVPLALVACIVAAGSYEWYRSGFTVPRETTGSAPSPEAHVPAPNAGTAQTELPNPLATIPSAEPAAENHDAATMNAAPTGAAAVAPSAAASSAEPRTGEVPSPATSEPSPAAAPSPPATTTAAAPAAEAPSPLVLTYRAASWTQVRDRTGQVIFMHVVPAGAERAIRGSAPFELVIGNANQVTLVYEGKPVDLARYTRQNVARLRLP
jgi:cytoskeleton protein RodZ